MGDIHGAYRALRQVLQRAHFDYTRDTLICLGDVCDGWPDTHLCIEELRGIRHCIFLLGNHDFHTLQWAETGWADEDWLLQGGAATRAAYNHQMPLEHVTFLKSAQRYWLERNRLFVHAGIWPGRQPQECGLNILLWDRTLVQSALHLHRAGQPGQLTAFDEVFVGHTPIGQQPLKGGEVWMMDTGAGWEGVLSMMDLDTYEVVASDPVPALYPGVQGRQRQR
jgi:serine/threonine protein phosphatase 1